MNAEDFIVPILNEIRQAAPSAHVAGGYLRDQDNGKAFKDVDMFVHGDADFDQAAHVILKTHPLMIGGNAQHYDAASRSRILASWVYDSPHNDYPQVNLIQLTDDCSTLDANLNEFDFGICQIAFDGEKVIRTAAYDRDKADQTFTLVNADTATHFDLSMDRWRRLKSKYPGWELVVPERFKHFQFEEIPF